jgi:hypothetical protein
LVHPRLCVHPQSGKAGASAWTKSRRVSASLRPSTKWKSGCIRLDKVPAGVRVSAKQMSASLQSRCPRPRPRPQSGAVWCGVVRCGVVRCGAAGLCLFL